MCEKNKDVKIFKGLRAFIACITAFLVVFSGISIDVFAGEAPASYYDRDAGVEKTVPAELVTADMTTWGEAGVEKWYVVKDKVEMNTRVTVTGDVHLILADGAELKAKKGINVSEENALTIYGQTDEVTQNTGKIDANGVSMSGIGGTDYGSACGKITITGGVVDAKSIYDGAGIGGGSGVDGGIITITGGTVTATSVNGAGIGGGANGSIGATLKGGTITISGGTVMAKSESGAGIGGGRDHTEGAAHGGTTGGNITINGGTVTASSMNGAGIGGGMYGKGGNVTIIDGTVTASSGGGAGIGGGLEGAGETTEISGGTVEAISIDGAGIGGGYKGSGGKITISGGTVKAIAKDYGAGNGAGIGGGKKGSGGNITISGGTVNALVYSYGNNSGAGIGGGYGADGGTITITGGTVLGATAGDGAGIGGGGADKESKNAGAGGKITITGGKVLANSTFGHGIGGGISKESGGHNGANGSFSTGADGKAMIISKSIADKNEQGSWQGIIFEVPNGNVYGNQELNEDFEIKEGQTLTIPAGITLTIHSGKTLIIKGKVRNFGTIKGNVQIVENGKLLERYPAPNVVIDYIAEKLIGFNKEISYEITPNDGSGETINKPADEKVDIKNDWLGKTLSIIAKEDDSHLDGIIQKLDIPNHPDAPTELKGVSETVYGKNDGKIIGTTAGMEYKPSFEDNWKPCTSNEILNLAPGVYKVRIAASGSNFVGEEAEITVKHAVPFTVPKAKTGLSYTGEKQELIERGTVEDVIGELQYSLEENGEYKTDIPEATDAGTYEVHYKVTGSNPDYDYSVSKGKVTVNIAKAAQAALSISDVTDKKYGDNEFTLTATGGSGTGVITYSVPVNNGILSINGSTAKIIGVGEVTVKAVKAGDKNHNEISAELKITIAKGDAPAITFPTASNLTYGQRLSESTLTGGSTGYGTFAWADGNIIPTVNNTGYEVLFTPSEKTEKNYEEIADANKKNNVSVIVTKANPTINLTANVSENSGSKTVMLSAEVEGTDGADKPTGNVKFSYDNAGTSIDIATVELAEGKASYKWENLEEKEYEIKVEYLGDNNYNAMESAVKKIDTRKQSQSEISFTAISDKTYGDGEFTLSITGGSGTGDIIYSVPANNGVLEINDDIAKIIGAGSTTITVKKEADTDYNEASRSIIITVAKKKLTVKAEDKTVIKGEYMPEFTYNKTEVEQNLASGDTFKNPVLTASVTDTNCTGEYDITVSGGELKNSANEDVKNNYEITYEKGILTIVAALYEVKVVDGTGSGKYSEGQTVSIKADDKSGYTFTGWTSDDGVVFADAAAKETSFVMPAKAVTVTATYNANIGLPPYISSEPEENDGTITIKPEKAPDLPIIVEITVKAKKGKDNTAKAKLSEKTAEKAIKKAKEEAGKKGKEANGIALEINMTMPKGTDKVQMQFSESTLEKLVNGEVKSLTVNNSLAKVVFDKNAIFEIKKQSKGEVSLNVIPVKKLSGEAKNHIGKRPVYDISLSSGNGKKITAFGNGKATVFLSYKAEKKEVIGGLYAVYVDEKEKASRIDRSAYDVNSSSVIFTTDHLSIYGVGYTAPSEKYDDTKNHWAKDYIDYVAGRGLITGSMENTFSPNEKMTRGMLVTALGRLAGVNSKDYDTNSFSDVQKDSTYRPYIEWAYSKGIVYGIGDGTFAPDKSITREEMAVIFERYAKATGYNIPASREASTYADKENIGSEYRSAVTAMQQSGIMMGIDGNKFNPKGTATRAEVSAMLSRYIKLTITPETAQGFALDDAGKYRCYKDGKALTGKQTINGMVYFFDESGVLQTGWVKDGNRWRYYDGAKAHKGWLHLKTDGEEKIYYLNKEGLLESGKWVKIDGKWYYFYPDGTLAVNTQIDGYEVDSKGVRKEK
ncbi:hypothetical protein EII17_13660 [Clostridiales bacterium COT073_COT-073]|nr:hypothetical protein EII17_13660 [Clostridiales bacterium COT073_COT-073]